MEFSHVSVLKEEAVGMLQIRQDGVYVDGTFGGGGHTTEILAKLGGSGRLIAFDQDQEAIINSKKIFDPWPGNLQLLHRNFLELKEALAELNIFAIDGLLLDLGVSSWQLDNPARGFSYRQDAPLDMRMDDRASLTAADVVNTYSEKELADILRSYGEEKWASRIAKFILEKRREKPISSTLDLVEIIKAAVPAKAREEKQHPAKRSFQALRIEVNKELDVIGPTLKAAASLLNPGGVLAVITFHSLEDRIVKTTFAQLCKGCICPPEFPICICHKKPQMELIQRKVLLPSQEEMKNNPRSRSAKLRGARKL